MEGFDLEMEPEALEPEVVADGELALARSLPPDFPLRTLLTYLPDPRLKARVDTLAEVALAVDVTADGGREAADAALVPLRAGIKDIEASFEEPASLANQLHKRLTGLRALFQEAGLAAVQTVSARIYAETKRLDRLAAEEQRRKQELADKQAREEAARAVKAAAAAGQPATVLSMLQGRAETATAPPVAKQAPPPLKGTSTVAKWKARFAGTNSPEPNPETTALSEPERQQMLVLLAAVAKDPALLPFVQVDWSYANRRAGSDKSTFAVPGLEAYDEGGTRAKGRR